MTWPWSRRSRTTVPARVTYEDIDEDKVSPSGFPIVNPPTRDYLNDRWPAPRETDNDA